MIGTSTSLLSSDQASREHPRPEGPHAPWQRGTNENTNKVLRRQVPKGTDLADITQERANTLADRLNTRPMGALSWDTPTECRARASRTSGLTATTQCALLLAGQRDRCTGVGHWAEVLVSYNTGNVTAADNGDGTITVAVNVQSACITIPPVANQTGTVPAGACTVGATSRVRRPRGCP